MLVTVLFILSVVLFVVYILQEIAINHYFVKNEYYYYKKYKNLKNKNKRYRRRIRKLERED